MSTALSFLQNYNPSEPSVLLFSDIAEAEKFCDKYEHYQYLTQQLTKGETLVELNLYHKTIFFIKLDETQQSYHSNEKVRIMGHQVYTLLKKMGVGTIQAHCISHSTPQHLGHFLEGLLLSNYQFNKYKTVEKAFYIKNVKVVTKNLGQPIKDHLVELQNIVEGVFHARDLVNEPGNILTAMQLSQEIKQIGETAGFQVTILDKEGIENLGMNCLLAVNKGSSDPPTFNILTYEPFDAINLSPLVLVGKGVTFDTGGLNLKTAPNAMETMKCDMAGAATVAGSLYAIAKNKLPIKVIGLIPATDNRPGNQAFAPGDVIHSLSGKTIEVVNTDAEGRLVLADTLSYAARYRPELVIDFATLTGAAMRAIGKEGTVYMGNAGKDIKEALEAAGNETYERLVEFPLWDEYKDQLTSEVADIKNLGAGNAGAITAGKFLEFFVDYDWLHLDIAGPAFIKNTDFYRGKHGTGVGVRLIYNFIKTKLSNYQKY